MRIPKKVRTLLGTIGLFIAIMAVCSLIAPMLGMTDTEMLVGILVYHMAGEWTGRFK